MEIFASGSTAAWSFKQIKPAKVERVFILGPSHHVYLPDCALPVVDKYETPLGDLMLDKRVIEELKVHSMRFEQWLRVCLTFQFNWC